jgi:L,D-transpeptidase ErfK/SrfK
VSHDIAGALIEHHSVAGETLGGLGARFGVDAAVLARANGRRAGAPLRPGTTICIDNRHVVPVVPEPLVINIPQRMLFVVAGGRAQLAFPAGLGRRSWPTPVGPFTILTKEIDPTWDVPISIQREMERAGRAPISKVAPGPANPLGDRWLGSSLPGIGVHGTNAPASIYHHQTHGCVRLHPDDIRTLFEQLPIGTAGRIIYEPLLLAVVDGRVYLESHPDVYGRLPNAMGRLRATAAVSGLTPLIEWDAAAAVIRESAGIARDVTQVSR